MIETFSTIAVSIFLEGLFFLLIGVIISGFIEVFVSEDLIKKLIPKNKYLAIVGTSLLGLIFPICECGIVPIIAKLLKKKVPLANCITLILSTPIVNVLVILSTYFAFADNLQILFLRIAGGFIISNFVGLIMAETITDENSVLNKNFLGETGHEIICDDHDPDHSCSHGELDLSAQTGEKVKLGAKLKSVIGHSVSDFFDTAKYYIIGILVTALVQTLIPRPLLTGFGTSFPLSNVFMIVFSYVLSVCSNTDAFIARSFATQFNTSALVGFLVFGAMMDIKTTLMLKKIFKTSFIIKLIVIIFSLVLLYSLLITYALRGGQ